MIFPRRFNVCVHDVTNNHVIVVSNCRMQYEFKLPLAFLDKTIKPFYGKPLLIEFSDFVQNGMLKVFVKQRKISCEKDFDDNEFEIMIQAL